MKAYRLFVFSLLVLLLVVHWGLFFGFQQGTSAIAWASALAQNAVAAQTAVDIPKAFSYQGTLRLANGSLATGAFNMTIRLYDVVTGGTPLFTETFANVAVRDGLFNVVVGDTQPLPAGLFANGQLYLGVTVDPDPELLPRQRLHPVPWAMYAATAQQALTAGAADSAVNASQTTVIREVGNGQGGAKQRQDYPMSLQRYVVEAYDNGIKPFSVPVDDTHLMDLCGDVDGCTLTLGMRNPDVTATDNRYIMSFPYAFSVAAPVNGVRTWHAVGFTDAGTPIAPLLRDGAGGSETVISSGDCRLTDGAVADGVDQGDTGLGFALLNWWGHQDSPQMVCVLVIND